VHGNNTVDGFFKQVDLGNTSGRPNWTNQTLVALAYAEETTQTNDITLVQNNTILSTYSKNRLVPFIETEVTAGSTPPPVVDVVMPGGSLMKVGTAICFDFNFPDMARSLAGADLVLGPSWYWASIGYSIWGDNKYRAVENGFTLFKCSADGVSGAVNPYGHTLSFKPTLSGDVYVTQIPVQPAVWTLYAHGGFVFGWLCLALVPCCCVLACFGREARHHAPSCFMKIAEIEDDDYVPSDGLEGAAQHDDEGFESESDGE